jgi:hypothetical protein
MWVKIPPTLPNINQPTNQMKNLEKFIERENEFLKMINEKPLDINNLSDLREIAQIIDCQASPENLYCDGEISHSEGIRKYRLLKECAKEIHGIDPTIKFEEL